MKGPTHKVLLTNIGAKYESPIAELAVQHLFERDAEKIAQAIATIIGRPVTFVPAGKRSGRTLTNPTLVHHKIADAASHHLVTWPMGPVADLYYVTDPQAKRIGQHVANVIGVPVTVRKQALGAPLVDHHQLGTFLDRRLRKRIFEGNPRGRIVYNKAQAWLAGGPARRNPIHHDMTGAIAGSVLVREAFGEAGRAWIDWAMERAFKAAAAEMRRLGIGRESVSTGLETGRELLHATARGAGKRIGKFTKAAGRAIKKRKNPRAVGINKGTLWLFRHTPVRVVDGRVRGNRVRYVLADQKSDSGPGYLTDRDEFVAGATPYVPGARGPAPRMNPRSHGEADEVSARELELFIENDADLYRQQHIPILKNLWKKMQRGVYDHAKAVKLWGYLVEAGAKKYTHEFAGPGAKWHELFTIPTRLVVAQSLAASGKAKLDNHEYGFQDESVRPARSSGVRLPRKSGKLGKAVDAALAAMLEPPMTTREWASVAKRADTLKAAKPADVAYTIISTRHAGRARGNPTNTLADWERRHGTTANKKGEARWIPDFIGRARAELWRLSDYVVSSVSGGTIWLMPRPKNNPRRRGSEAARARRTFRMWHGFDPRKATRMRGPDRVIPGTLVKLGDLKEVVYRSDKWEGQPTDYVHQFHRPYPVLATDPDARHVHIVGGKHKVTADGLVH